MTLLKVLLTLCVTVGLNAFGATPRGFAQLPSVQRQTGAVSAPVNYPQGTYVSPSPNGDLVFHISKSNIVRTDFGIQMTNGMNAPMDFPSKLRFQKDEEIYSTRGAATLTWNTNMGILTCRYPVSLEIEDLGNGDSVRARFTVPNQMTLDAYGRCVSIGTRNMSARFDRE